MPAPQIMVVPGGPGQRAQMADGPVREWLLPPTRGDLDDLGVHRLAHPRVPGLLAGRRATTHWWPSMSSPTRRQLRQGSRRVDGKYVTAAGVSAGIDMALTLAELIAGHERAQAIQLGIEYDPQPPYSAGSPATAPAHVVAALRSRSRFTSAKRSRS